MRGTPVPVLRRLVTTGTGAGDLAVTAGGTLVYVDAPGGVAGPARTLVWVDRQGREEPLGLPPRAYLLPRISPDGTRVALYSADQQLDLWRWDLPRGPLTRLTLDPAGDYNPVWTRDGKRVVFGSQRGDGKVWDLYWQAADGTGTAERLTRGTVGGVPTSLTPDGNGVIFNEIGPITASDLMLLSLNRDRGVTRLLETPFFELNGEISPDGRWLAYESNSSGAHEIYVRPFPSVTEGQWLLSSGGGTQPLWAPSGRELYYLAADGTLTSVPVTARAAVWQSGAPAKVLQARYFRGGVPFSRNYDISRDGQRFLMIKQAADPNAASAQIILVQNWLEELKRLVPVN